MLFLDLLARCLSTTTCYWNASRAQFRCFHSFIKPAQQPRRGRGSGVLPSPGRYHRAAPRVPRMFLRARRRVRVPRPLPPGAGPTPALPQRDAPRARWCPEPGPAPQPGPAPHSCLSLQPGPAARPGSAPQPGPAPGALSDVPQPGRRQGALGRCGPAS